MLPFPSAGLLPNEIHMKTVHYHAAFTDLAPWLERHATYDAQA
jgi:hypothetical protein